MRKMRAAYSRRRIHARTQSFYVMINKKKKKKLKNENENKAIRWNGKKIVRK